MSGKTIKVSFLSLCIDMVLVLVCVCSIITMDLQEVGCWGIDWFKLAQDRDRW